MIIDLSHEINSNTPTHPYDDLVRLEQKKFLARDYFNDYTLMCGMHAGTHIDGPGHLTESVVHMSEVPVSRFIGPAIILDVRGRVVIDVDVLEIYVPSFATILFYTGHDELWGRPEYFTDHPVLSDDCVRGLIDLGVSMIGLDTPSPDRLPYALHKKLLERGIFIIENLTNLGFLVGVKPITICALPLKVNADSSPARVVAICEELE